MKLGPDAFDVEIGNRGISIVRASGRDPQLVIDGTESVLRAVMFHDLSLDDGVAAGDLRIRGDRTRAAAFLRHFKLAELLADASAA